MVSAEVAVWLLNTSDGSDKAVQSEPCLPSILMGRNPLTVPGGLLKAVAADSDPFLELLVL